MKLCTVLEFSSSVAAARLRFFSSAEQRARLGFSGSRQVLLAHVAAVSPPVRSSRFSFSQASASAGLRIERCSRFSLHRIHLALARVRSNILVRSQASPDAGARL
jgi:hypothetical protein